VSRSIGNTGDVVRCSDIVFFVSGLRLSLRSDLFHVALILVIIINRGCRIRYFVVVRVFFRHGIIHIVGSRSFDASRGRFIAAGSLFDRGYDVEHDG
jgi:hypothetical protein